MSHTDMRIGQKGEAIKPVWKQIRLPLPDYYL